jgi:hypothetical protein
MTRKVTLRIRASTSPGSRVERTATPTVYQYNANYKLGIASPDFNVLHLFL